MRRPDQHVPRGLPQHAVRGAVGGKAPENMLRRSRLYDFFG